MFNRRSFFRHVAAVVAAVALAPEIAFNVRLKPTELALDALTPFWLAASCVGRYQSDAYERWRETVMQTDEWKEFLKS